MKRKFTQDQLKTLQDLQDSFQRDLEAVQDKLKSMREIRMLEGHNTICAWPETLLTVCTNDEGHPIVSSRLFASQWTPAGAKEVIAKVKNGRGESPVAMTPMQYYTAKEAYISETIKSLNNE